MTSTLAVRTQVHEPAPTAHVEPRTRAGRVLSSTPATALILAIGYLAGAWIGFSLVFPPTTPSVLWPPNSIVTIALMLAPVSRWWMYLLAVLPAHLLIELDAGLPLSMVLPLFVTNCGEAVLAAAGVRAFSGTARRFNTLRAVAVFVIAAALMAPLVSSFFDAAIVALLRGEQYWLVWRTRFFSNALTALTLVPAGVYLITSAPRWIRSAPPARRVEAVVFALGLFLFGIVATAAPVDGLWTIPGSPRTPMVFLLPFLLWAAVRFGPGGTSLSLLMTTAIAIVAGMNGRGPFADLPPVESVLALQIFLIAIGVPLLTLAAVLDERRRAEDALGEQLSFERLLSRLSTAFVHLSGHRVDRALETWLGTLGEFLGIDTVAALHVSADGYRVVTQRCWRSSDSGFDENVLPDEAAARVIEGLRDGVPFVVSRTRRSCLVIPMMVGTRLFGGLVFLTRPNGAWQDEQIQQLTLVADVFATALARKEAEDALRATEAMKSAILNSLTDGVAVLNREGRIIVVNESWPRFARASGLHPQSLGIGVSYLDVCRRGVERGAISSTDAPQGVEAVCSGSRARFGFECVHRTDPVSWWAISVEPLNRPGGGAVVSHTNVTERKRAEIDAQRSREDLAHVTRTSTMAELAASLAHELNQPLTGIMTNAQTALQLARVGVSGEHELRETLAEIAEDTRRASEVVRRIRELVSKGDPTVVPLNLNGVIEDVTRLLASDTIIRNVKLELELRSGQMTVNADPVQLRQVVLNLVLNALEAVSESANGGRTVTVRTARAEENMALVSVEDTGPGLREGAETRVFEPFYTTKPGGMGMGLAIARSIVEAHGGRISVRSNRDRGATFYFTLPLALAKPE